jgi:hypothetical protein
MQIWKYLVEEVQLSRPDTGNGPPDENAPQELLQKALDDSSSGGWELVCLLPARGSDSKMLAIFKQPATD